MPGTTSIDHRLAIAEDSGAPSPAIGGARPHTGALSVTATGISPTGPPFPRLPRAINSQGNGTTTKPYTGDGAADATTVPGAPTGLTATANGSTRSTSTGPSRPTTATPPSPATRSRFSLDRPRGQHQQHHHHLLPHRPFPRHHPPLPRLGHQLGRHRRRLQHVDDATTDAATTTGRAPGPPPSTSTGPAALHGLHGYGSRFR